MLFRCTRRFLILALCVSISAHWFILQSLAWTTMVVRYSQHASLPQALAQTFDGHHPCNLCKGISAAKHSENKNDAVRPIGKKVDLICATRWFGLFSPHSDIPFAGLSVTPPLRFDSPPTPPPRRELA